MSTEPTNVKRKPIRRHPDMDPSYEEIMREEPPVPEIPKWEREVITILDGVFDVSQEDWEKIRAAVRKALDEREAATLIRARESIRVLQEHVISLEQQWTEAAAEARAKENK